MFVLRDDGELVEMQERQYDSESLLQSLLARYPNLLAGNQIDAAVPRRWLLVSREMPVPAEERGAGRWSVDHLFLDQDAIPTIVEVKRSTDTRIRREVVGQMLDYAANAVVYWPIEKLRAMFEATCAERSIEPELEVESFLGGQKDAEGFWQQAKTNLQAGRVRLVFVADEIPAELRRVVEFLNAQMDPAEVLAVEIKQFVGQGLTTLVPRVLGVTAEAKQKNTGGSSEERRWDEASFVQALTERRGRNEAEIAKHILRWANTHGLRLWWGKGLKDGSFFPLLDYQGRTYWLISVWTYGRIEVQFQWMTAPPLDSMDKRRELQQRLNSIQGIDIRDDALTKRPSLPLALLADDAKLKQFLEVFDWLMEEAKAH